MARHQHRAPATMQRHLAPHRRACWACGHPLWMLYQTARTVTTVEGVCRLTLTVRRCVQPTCPLYHRPYRPEEETAVALPHGEFGLDVIALIGTLRYADHRSVPEIHRALQARGIPIAERTVTYLIERYEELVTVRLADQSRLRDRLQEQGRVVLALDGLQPDKGHEVLWVLRDVLSGEVLLARSLLGATADDVGGLIRALRAALPVPIVGVISDGQESIRLAVARTLPGVPHQLCQFHYLREAARPLYEADRHAKKELKKQVRGVRPIEKSLEGRDDPEAEAVRGYCLAVRGALSDEGHPPLDAPGLALQERIAAIHASIERVAAKRGACRGRWSAWMRSSGRAWRRPPFSGRICGKPMSGCGRRPISWGTTLWSGRSRTDRPRIERCWPRSRPNATRSPRLAQPWSTSSP